MKKCWRVSIVVLMVVLLLSNVGIAQAWWGWSFGDPQLIVDGHTVNIWIDIDGDQDEIAASIKKNISVEVTVPNGMDAELDFESDILGYSTETEIKYGDTDEIKVSVKVSTSEDFPMSVNVLVDDKLVATENDETNKKIRLEFALDDDDNDD